MKKENNTMQTKEGLHTLGEKSFGNLELWEDSKDCDFFYSLKAYTKDGLQTIVRTDSAVKDDKENCEYILRAVNERRALLDALEKLHESSVNLLVEVIDIPHPTSMDDDLRKLSEILKEVKKNIKP